MKTEELLIAFIELLKREKELLMQSAKDYSLAKSLDNVRQEKESIIEKLSKNPEDLKKYPNYLEEIETLSQINMELAANSMQFIQKLFEAIFEEEESTTYGKNGEISTSKRTILNKKA